MRNPQPKRRLLGKWVIFQKAMFDGQTVSIFLVSSRKSGASYPMMSQNSCEKCGFPLPFCQGTSALHGYNNHSSWTIRKFNQHPEFWELPSGYVKIAIENGPVEIVDFPMKNGGFSSSLC
jgi:hypothetical protein